MNSMMTLPLQNTGFHNPWYASNIQSLSAEKRSATTAEENPKATQMRQLLRDLKRNQNPYMPSQSANPYASRTTSTESKKEKEAKKPSTYNYKEIASKILRAKNSISAGQAYLSAKRKVLEIKRKISNADGDAEELQLALTHAKRMEMAARSKKHHLELEEQATNCRKLDEKQDKLEEASSDMTTAMISEEEEEVTEQEDAIFEEREEMLEEATAEMEENGEELSDEMLSELNEMIAEFGEEELEMLEEAMEMLEDLEMLDPHMTEEELEELKRKHRTAEQKAIMKADMDYLKGMIKHQMEKGGDILGLNSSGTPAASTFSAAVPQTMDVSVPCDVSIDIGL